MKGKVFGVFFALAAVSTAAPHHHQTSILEDPSAAKSAPFQRDCWLVCWEHRRQCPRGWYSSKEGTCWTCCRVPAVNVNSEPPFVSSTLDNEKMKITIQISDTSPASSASSPLDDPSRRGCRDSIPHCPSGWFPKRSGRCWTCGQRSDEVDASEESGEDIELDLEVDTTTAWPTSLHADFCWPVCRRSIQHCIDGWYSNNKGTAKRPCWTCCKAPIAISDEVDASGERGEDMKFNLEADIETANGKEDIAIDIRIDTTTAGPISLHEDPCWRYPNNKGTSEHPCWTCCKAPKAKSHLLDLPVDL
ncbi:hypothetical protein V493_01288 [Pseudogymnoascus sp. VKM F-4281 (FW-2241)]|nr:hypothetical protein V493_01288 [Pseudogymnoascus sp. VKM F-4281 (FW-2241)]